MVDEGASVMGYEIHNGVSEGSVLSSPLLHIEKQPEGAISGDGRMKGTYLRRLFDHPDACQALLKRLDLANGERSDNQANREREFDRLADILKTRIDINAIIALIEAGA